MALGLARQFATASSLTVLLTCAAIVPNVSPATTLYSNQSVRGLQAGGNCAVGKAVAGWRVADGVTVAVAVSAGVSDGAGGGVLVGVGVLFRLLVILQAISTVIAMSSAQYLRNIDVPFLSVIHAL